MLIHHTLGGRPVTIHAPGTGEIDPMDYEPSTAAALAGLDVESTGLEPSGVHHPQWRLRTVQIALSDDYATVLRMDDLDQRWIAAQTLSDPNLTFASHTRIDVEAVCVDLSVDISSRCIDTHVLAVMASPDAVAGQGSLKPAAGRFGLPELADAEDALTAECDRLYRIAHPEIGRRAIAEKALKKWGFTHIPVENPAFVLYAGLDALAARRLVPLLAAASRAPAHVLTTERWLSQVATRMVRRGMRVDRDRLAEVIASAGQEAAEATEICQSVSGLKPTQGVKLLEWWAGTGVDWDSWPAEARTDNGAPSMAKDNIEILLAMDLTSDARTAADAYARHAKVLDRNRRTAELVKVMDPQGRVHPNLSTVGTVTSRMACSAPNMQNFAKTDYVMRGLFVPEDGHVLISSDFSQVELRVVAALSQEQSMIDTILGGGDLHQLTADLLGVSRQEAKTINFLIVYGGGSKPLAEGLKFKRSLAECKQIIRDYWAKYPAISGLNNVLKEQSGVRLISGRWVPGSQGRGYALMNYLIQGSARELLVAAARRFSRGDEFRERMFWMFIHDEHVLQVPIEIAEQIRAEISESMSFDFYGVPITAEADILLDEHGQSRWMSGDRAVQIREMSAHA